jgi:hypothetical protein
MPEDDDVIWGTPGTTYTNDTDVILYQLEVAWENTCGVCAQYDGAIGPAWPIPFHHNCRCEQTRILPGDQAKNPFTDYREKIETLSDSQKTALVGSSNYKLIEEGVVDWEDVVTSSRVRTLREVVATQKLTVDDLTGAGVREYVAQDAYASVNTPEHQLIAEERKKLIEQLKNAGLSKDAVRQLAAEGLASRVAIAEGLTVGEGAAGTMPDADRVASFLAGWTGAANQAAAQAMLDQMVKETAAQKIDETTWLEQNAEGVVRDAYDAWTKDNPGVSFDDFKKRFFPDN